MLNGTLTGNSQSNVIATLSPIANDKFTLGGATSTLAGLPNEVLLVPNSAGGVTTLEGAINTNGLVNPQAPVPEPSTIALFLSTVGGLALRRYVLARRRSRLSLTSWKRETKVSRPPESGSSRPESSPLSPGNPRSNRSHRGPRAHGAGGLFVAFVGPVGFTHATSLVCDDPSRYDSRCDRKKVCLKAVVRAGSRAKSLTYSVRNPFRKTI